MKMWFPLALVVGLCLLPVRSADSINSGPSPPECDPDCASPADPPAISREENIPVVITDGEGTEWQAEIAQGIMTPTGIPFDQSVTVSLFVSSQVPGTPVRVGLFDGGQIAPPTNIPEEAVAVGARDPDAPVDALTVLADQTVRFDFQPSGVGLYRALITVGTKQYLVQLYARRPRSAPPPGPLPLITPPPG